jgi:hypothetical protein
MVKSRYFGWLSNLTGILSSVGGYHPGVEPNTGDFGID